MRFKHNPFVSVVALALLGAILLWFCTGCSTTAAEEPLPAFTEATEAEKSSPRFTKENISLIGGVGYVYVITDNETGAEYLAIANTYGMGLTKLGD